MRSTPCSRLNSRTVSSGVETTGLPMARYSFSLEGKMVRVSPPVR
jgi:hypothetical protein